MVLFCFFSLYKIFFKESSVFFVLINVLMFYIKLNLSPDFKKMVFKRQMKDVFFEFF